VTVPAGTFAASSVDLTFTNHKDPARPVRCRFWYAPGVGPVKWTTTDGGEVVLKTFSTGRD
jgi:hypothetical protein